MGAAGWAPFAGAFWALACFSFSSSFLFELVVADGTTRRRARHAVAGHVAHDCADGGILRAAGLRRRRAEAGPEGKGQRCRRNQD